MGRLSDDAMMVPSTQKSGKVNEVIVMHRRSGMVNTQMLIWEMGLGALQAKVLLDRNKQSVIISSDQLT